MFQPIKWLKPIFTGLPKPSTPSLVLNIGITFLIMFKAPSVFNDLLDDLNNHFIHTDVLHTFPIV